MGNSLCRIWGLRDRDAHGEGGTNRFRDFDAFLRDLNEGIEITMPSACVTESPSPLAIAQGPIPTELHDPQ
jgi:hypothetical protein